MPKGAASKDKKPAEKKGGDKGKGKAAEEAVDKGGKVRANTRNRTGLRPCFVVLIGTLQGKGGLKAATAVNVRHILCEKHSKAMEALQRIQVRHTFIFSRRHSFLIIYRDLSLVSSCYQGRRAIRQSRSGMFRGQGQRYIDLLIHQGIVLKTCSCKPVVVWAGWFADRWWYVPFASNCSEWPHLMSHEGPISRCRVCP